MAHIYAAGGCGGLLLQPPGLLRSSRRHAVAIPKNWAGQREAVREWIRGGNSGGSGFLLIRGEGPVAAIDGMTQGSFRFLTVTLSVDDLPRL